MTGVVIRYEYDLEYVRRGARNPVTVSTLSECEVEIAEVDRADVRTVHRVGTRGRKDKDKGVFSCIDTRQGGRPVEVVEIEGRLYAESVPLDALASLVRYRGEDRRPHPFDVTPRDGSEVRARFGDLLGPSHETPAGRVTKEEVAAKVRRDNRIHGDVDPFRSWKDDGGARVEAVVKARAAELRVVDGRVYVPCSEPVLAVDHDYDAVEGGCRTLAVVDETTSGGWSAFEWCRVGPARRDGAVTYPLDRAGDLAAFCASYASHEDDVVSDRTVLDLVSPGEVRCGGAGMLYDAAHNVVRSMDTTVLALSPEAATAWAVLRDAVVRSDGRLDRPLLTAARSFLARVDDTPLPGEGDPVLETTLDNRHLGTKVRWTGMDVERLRTALDSYEATASTGAAWTHMVADVPPGVDGRLVAREVSSSEECDRLCETMGSSRRFSPPGAGQAVVTVSGGLTGRCRGERLPSALALVDADRTVVEMVTMGGRPASPAVKAALQAHAVACIDARDLTAWPSVTREDEEALVF